MFTVTLLQPNPHTGDFDANAEAAVALLYDQVTNLGDLGEKGLVILPEGGLTGVMGEGAFRRPELRRLRQEAVKRFVAHVHQTLGQAVLIHEGSVLGFYPVDDDPVEFDATSGSLSLDGVTIAWGAETGTVQLHFHDLTSFSGEAFAPTVTQPTLFVGTAGGFDRVILPGNTGLAMPEATFSGLTPFRAGVFSVSLNDKGEVEAVQGTTSGTKRDQLAPEAGLLYEALRASLRDYVTKNKLPGITLGLSGGIDSALLLALSVDAVGADKVRAVLLPSRFTSDLSETGAKALLDAWGVQHERLSIEPLFKAALETLSPVFGDRAWDVTEENLQARARMMLLMGLANKDGTLLLCTSNKSESAMGFGTLYGDLSGGFAPLIDVWKSQVRALCRARNDAAGREVIPEVIISRPPTAELRENQTDEDTLPPYDEVEAVVTAFMEGVAVDALPSPRASEILRKLLGFGFKRAQGIPGPVVSTTPLTQLADFGVTRAAYRW